MESQSGDFGEEGLALGAPARLLAEPPLFLPQLALLLVEPPRLLAVLPIQDDGPMARAGPT